MIINLRGKLKAKAQEGWSTPGIFKALPIIAGCLSGGARVLPPHYSRLGSDRIYPGAAPNYLADNSLPCAYTAAMNHMICSALIAAGLLGLLSPIPGNAQLPSNPAGLNAAMTKLFGNVTAFSSKAEVKMLDKAQKETMSMNMDFALLEGKIRADIDFAQVKNAEMAGALAQLKQMGMDRMSSIVRPDKKTTLIIYPGLQAYAETPMPPEESAALEKNYKIEKTKLGKETIDGQPCDKNKVVVSGEKGEKHEAIVWTATNMKDFPVQMQMNQNEATVVMKYKDVQLKAPDAKQFEAPAGYTKHESMEKLMQGAMLKMLGGGK